MRGAYTGAVHAFHNCVFKDFLYTDIMLTLAIQKRDTGGAEMLRRAGKLPAVCYGRKEPSTPIFLPLADFKKVLKQAGESTVITLLGLGETKEVLIHEVDFEPVTGEPRHADFYIIEKGRKVTVTVPLVFIGTAPAVKELGGALVKVLHEVEVEAMPKDLPHEIAVDVSSLARFDDRILVQHIKLPAGVAITEKPEEVVALVAEAEAESLEGVATPDFSTIEVEKRGKEVEPEGGLSAEKTEE